MIESIHCALGVGWKVPPIINAFKVSSRLSARETGPDIIDVRASNIMEATANSAIIRERPTSCRIRRRPWYPVVGAPVEIFGTAVSRQQAEGMAVLGDHPPPSLGKLFSHPALLSSKRVEC